MCHRDCRAFQLARVDSSQALFPEPLPPQAKRQAAVQRSATRRHRRPHHSENPAAQWVGACRALDRACSHSWNEPFGRCEYLHAARKLLRLQTVESNIRAPQITRRIGCKLPVYVAYAKSSRFHCSQRLAFLLFPFPADCKRKLTDRSSRVPATSRSSLSTTTKRSGAMPKNSSRCS